MSIAVPTLHRIATYPAAGTRANTTTTTAATGKIANLISPLPTIAPASAAAASVAASQASVPRGSDAESTRARSPVRFKSTSPSKVTSVMRIGRSHKDILSPM